MAQLVKTSTCSAGELGLIPGLGRSPGEGKGYPLQHSGLENSMDYIVHGVTESDRTERLSLSLTQFYILLPLSHTLRIYTHTYPLGFHLYTFENSSSSFGSVLCLLIGHTNASGEVRTVSSDNSVLTPSHLI